MREANLADVPLIEKWLRNSYDCKMATGHVVVSAEDIRKWLRSQNQVCCVLESAVGPVGYGEIWVDAEAKDIELAHFIISPNHRSQGFGKLLTKLLFDQGKRYGFPVAFMRLYPENTPALKCYASLEFTPVNDRELHLSGEWNWLSKAYVNQD